MHTITKKLSHIWDYYKIPLIGIPLGILFLIYVITSLITPSATPFSVYFINQEISPDAITPLEDQFSSLLPSVADIGGVAVHDDIMINKEAPDADSQMEFTTAIAAHTIDVMITDTLFVEQYASMKALYDLSALLPQELFAKLTPYLIFATDENGATVAYGIDLSSCPQLTDYHLDAPILTVAKYTEQPELCIQFIEALFAEVSFFSLTT